MAASMTYGPAAAQQLPLGPFDGAPGAVPQAGVPAGQLPARRASNRIARSIPQFSGAVEPSLSNPIPPRQPLNPPRLAPTTGMQSPSGQSPFGLPADSQAASQPAPGAVDPITGLPLHLLNGPPQTASRQNLPQQTLTSDPLAAPFSIPGCLLYTSPSPRDLH